MTVPEHSSKAEELAAEAVRYLSSPDGKDAAAAWAAVAQVYAMLAVAAAIEAASISRGRSQIPVPGIGSPPMPEPPLPGVGRLPGLQP